MSDDGRTQAGPDAAQAHARIVDALRDPLAFAVALGAARDHGSFPGGTGAGNSGPGLPLFSEHTQRGNNHAA